MGGCLCGGGRDGAGLRPLPHFRMATDKETEIRAGAMGTRVGEGGGWVMGMDGGGMESGAGWGREGKGWGRDEAWGRVGKDWEREGNGFWECVREGWGKGWGRGECKGGEGDGYERGEGVGAGKVWWGGGVSLRPFLGSVVIFSSGE